MWLYCEPKSIDQKLAEYLSFHIKYCDLHLKENLKKANFISLKKYLPKAPVQLGVKY